MGKVLGRLFSWVLALAFMGGIVIGIGFERPELLPKPVHDELLKQGLAKPIQAKAAVAAPQAAAPGQPARPGGQGGPGGAPGGGGPRPVAIEAAKVRTATMTATLTAVGSLRADETVVVSPEVEGRISEVLLKEGAVVQAGDVLFRLDDQMLKAELMQAKAELALAEANFERADTLFRQKSGTERSRDESRYALDKSRANVELVQSRLDKATIRAPFGGVVGLRSIAVGEYVTKGEQLVVLSRVDPIKVDFRLPEVELGSVSVGAKIKIEVDALPGKAWEGEVFAIDPQVDINGRALQLRARVANRGGELKPGLFARVELTTASRQNAVVVPETAVVSQGRERFVFTIRDGKAVRSKIVTGLRQPGVVEIVQGLSKDDVVVVTGQQRLRDGIPVDVVGSGPTT